MIFASHSSILFYLPNRAALLSHVFGIYCKFIFVATVICALHAFQSSSHAKSMIYDSSLCKSSADNHIYVTLYGAVFKLPTDYPLYIVDLPTNREAYVPEPLDKSEQEGCPDNPIAGQSFSFAYHYHDLKRDVKLDRTDKLDKLRLFSSPPDFYGTQKSVEEHFYWSCSEFGSTDYAPKGFSGCYATAKYIDMLNTDIESFLIPATYKANDNFYSAPLGRPFIVDCPYSIGFDSDIICSVTYKLLPTVNISYEFRGKSVDISKVRELDKHIRGSIMGSYVGELSRPFPDIMNHRID